MKFSEAQTNRDEILTIDDVAALLKVSRKTLQNRISRGDDLPRPFRIPGARGPRWLRSEIERWVAEKAGKKVRLRLIPSNSAIATRRGRKTKKQALRERAAGLRHWQEKSDR